MGYGEKRFKKKFPNLKQVINDHEVGFEMYGQVPLRFGQNEVYLKNEDGSRTVLTDFVVDENHKYAMKIIYNYPYIIEEIKVRFLFSMIFIIGVCVGLTVAFAPYFKYMFLVGPLLAAIGYGLTIEVLVSKLGIRAYKVEVTQTPK